jgi:hypothetical protein
MIHERLKNRYYTHAHLFKADMIRLFNNCREQFTSDSEQYKCANRLQNYFEKRMADSGFASV